MTSFHCLTFSATASCNAFTAGISRCFTLTAAAMFIAVGNVSLDDWAMLTWSLGCTGALLPSGVPASWQQRYAVQHERERGDLQPVLPTRRYAAWEQGPGASQRPRQHGPVVQRHVSLGNEHRGGGQCEAAAYPGSEGVARCGC